MDLTAVLISLPIVVAGVWYLFNAGNARSLLPVDGERVNAIRVRLRRVNGMVITTAGFAFFYVVTRTRLLAADAVESPGILLPLAVIALVPLFVLMLVLVWLDIRMTRRVRRGVPRGLAPVAAALLLVAGCGDATQQETAPVEEPSAKASPAYVPTSRPSPQVLPTADVVIGDRTYRLMVADDPEERATGLMYRRDMAENEGMIFLFDRAITRSFYMRNTPLPLDIIFLDIQDAVVNVGRGRPLTDRPTVLSDGPTLTVIELNRGQAEAVGLQPGDVIDLAPARAIADIQ